MGLTVALAATLHSHWALLAAPVVVPLINFGLSAGLIDWRPGRPSRSEGIESLLRFGRRICATNLLTFVSRNVDNLIVAGTSSAQQLGLYDRSYRVLLYPLTQAVVPLGQVLVPTLTRAIEDTAEYSRQFWQSSTLLLLAVVPGLALVIVFPETMIGLLLGPAWLDGAPLFACFAAAAIAEIVLAQLNWLLMSQGRARDVLRSGMVASLSALAAFCIGTNWGIIGMAVAFALARILISLPVTFALAGRRGPINRVALAGGYFPHILALSATLSALFGARGYWGTPGWSLLIPICCIAYCLNVLIVTILSRGLPWQIPNLK